MTLFPERGKKKKRISPALYVLALKHTANQVFNAKCIVPIIKLRDTFEYQKAYVWILTSVPVR